MHIPTKRQHTVVIVLALCKSYISGPRNAHCKSDFSFSASSKPSQNCDCRLRQFCLSLSVRPSVHLSVCLSVLMEQLDSQ